MKKFIVPLFILFSVNAFAQKQKSVILYPDGIPGAKPAPKTYVEKLEEGSWILKVSTPTLTPYLPAPGTANGTAVIVLPGGGYAGLASIHEGDAIAKEFNKIGVTAFVLKYRLPNDSIMADKKIGPLQDVQRAVQMVRERAAEWKIKPDRVGIIGFSAGGHLASTGITHFNKAVIPNKNNTNLRPDFGMLIYPVISFGEFTHQGSKENLIGKDPSADVVREFSNELQVTPETPPTFLVHAEDDTVVPVQNSLHFYNALLTNKVKAEMHLYPAGGHGFGLVNPTTKELWFNSLANWMASNGWLSK
ncbi:alpha/beta hydrolase [Mucilaginibacter sp. UR6-1]|uniref:alpha/beta hydrolase n=1 Tax=Mucilaginibacter sp. UR6-1 TaxID=1435643 RepID=UPI001E3514AB|nr:alpha/beta hydrolase [Mucilaginibacter sp. UR6-1]MCC8410865.1 alpha/beta hydrolase [Mucilaginibacter sp. UR6-1]